jgi:hypothetical protein
VLACETGVLLVLTDRGAVRATYGARLLGLLARDRAASPQPGEWVVLRRWCDGPVTVEETLAVRSRRWPTWCTSGPAAPEGRCRSRRTPRAMLRAWET